MNKLSVNGLGFLFQANEDVTQIVKIFNDGAKKWQWLTSNIVRFTSGKSRLLVSVGHKGILERKIANLFRIYLFLQ